MKFRIRRSDDHRLIQSLDKAIFPYDDPYQKNGALWWVAKTHDKEIAAFAGLKVLSGSDQGTGFLCRSGVFPAFRGNGLQRRLIKVREREARKLGLSTLLTYTTTDNTSSANNLIKCGYQLYEPVNKYAGDDSILYFKKDL